MVLIGGGHDDDHGNYVRRQADEEEGIINVTKASAFRERLRDAGGKGDHDQAGRGEKGS